MGNFWECCETVLHLLKMRFYLLWGVLVLCYGELVGDQHPHMDCRLSGFIKVYWMNFFFYYVLFLLAALQHSAQFFVHSLICSGSNGKGYPPFGLSFKFFYFKNFVTLIKFSIARSNLNFNQATHTLQPASSTPL